MRKIWRVKEPSRSVQDILSSELRISRITAQLLANRGITDPDAAREFLSCSFNSCHDPFLLKDMRKAIDRIRKAIAANEKVLVYGDYDVDGMTATAIAYSALKELGCDASYYIPNRVDEGYGLNITAIKSAERNGVSLLVTVDCGVTSFKEIEYAQAVGIDVIVTDHHEIHEGRVPAAFAVINPLQPGCGYPFKHLAGVGLAYKLAKALYDGTAHFAEDFLDLVSLGTVADISPLVGENRVLTKHGLDELSRRSRPGVKALASVAGLGDKAITGGHIGFALGPRLNAMGRIGSPIKALELLLSRSDDEALALAKMLDSENKNRQKIEGRILEEALSKVEREINFKEHKVIVLASEGWHSGVIGVVASRLVDRFYRPTILISLDGKFGKGSGRSVENFDLFDHLLKCKDHLIGFGGHELACGVTIDKDKVDEFRDRINREAAKDADEKVFSPTLEIEMEVPLSDLNEDVIAEIDRLSPFGPENPRPVLSSSNLIVKDGPRNIGKSGFKLWVTDKRVTCEAVSFGRQELHQPDSGSPINVAYQPSINNWQGVSSIQLELKDVVQA